MINAFEIRQAWREVFPKSHISGHINYFTGRLQVVGEWSNGIAANDPLRCLICLGNDYVAIEGSILTNPLQPHHYASGAKWRRKTLKNPDYAKVVKAFKEIRAFILAHEAEWHNQYAAIIKEKLS